jgi:hypothetical protein
LSLLLVYLKKRDDSHSCFGSKAADFISTVLLHKKEGRNGGTSTRESSFQAKDMVKLLSHVMQQQSTFLGSLINKDVFSSDEIALAQAGTSILRLYCATVVSWPSPAASLLAASEGSALDDMVNNAMKLLEMLRRNPSPDPSGVKWDVAIGYLHLIEALWHVGRSMASVSGLNKLTVVVETHASSLMSCLASFVFNDYDHYLTPAGAGPSSRHASQGRVALKLLCCK